jgi:hypothetical protein
VSRDCQGLHCPGCGDGGIKVWVIAGAIAVAVAVEVAEWVAAHAIELMLVTFVAAGLAVAAVAALYRWTARREAAWGASHAAQRAAGIGNAITDLAPSAGRPAIVYRDLHIHLDGEQADVIRQALDGRN